MFSYFSIKTYLHVAGYILEVPLQSIFDEYPQYTISHLCVEMRIVSVFVIKMNLSGDVCKNYTFYIGVLTYCRCVKVIFYPSSLILLENQA